ncbi:MAG: putative glycoside hydrolase [Mycobacteriales bacterium]
MPRLRRPAVLVPAAAVVVLVAAVPAALARTGGSLTVAGLPDHALLGAKAVAGAAIRVTPKGVDASSVKATIDGKAAMLTGRTVSLAGLSDGKHVLTVTAPRSFLGSATVSREFTVDTTPPALTVKAPDTPVKIKDAVDVTGTVESGAKVSADGGQLTMSGTSFTVHYAIPPAGAKVVATDAAGNTSERDVTVPTAYPSNIRAVHVTGAAWAYDPLRLPVLKMIKEHRINAVELDIKDEDGIINYDSQIPLAKAAKSTFAYYSLPKVTSLLHSLGVRVIGRVVAFNDPKLAAYAEAHHKSSWFIQNPDGSKYLYGYNKHGFTNFANPDVRKYNQDIAVEAIQGGFDDVVYDYIRRPDGKLAGMRFPGLTGNPEDSIVSFLAEAQARIRPLGGSLGAAAFAQASTRFYDTAQNIPKMAKHLDVVIPMDYPSHWNPGEYGVPDTYVGAYDIVKRSLVDWLKDVKGTSCVVVPWLQDENYRGQYTADKVREQIKGARDNGIAGWLMWSAGASYTAAAYSTDAKPAR